MSFIGWLRSIWEKIMLTRETIKTLFGVEPPLSSPMRDAIELWAKMYANESPWLADGIYSLNLAATIAAEVARNATIEATVLVEGSPRADFLNAQMETIMDEIREQAEYGIALGGMVMKPFIDPSGKLAIDYIKADSFFPVEFDSNGNMTGVIFVDKRKIGDFWFTKLEYHQMVEGGCEVRNLLFRSTNDTTLGNQVPLAVVPEWAELLPLATIQGIEKPLFAYFRYPLANNIDRSSKLGVSCYSRAVNLIEQADKQWSNFLWEFESGQRALYVDILAFGRTPDGKPVLPNKRLYRTLDSGGQADALFEDWSPTFRQADLLAGLDAILKRIEFSTGLAYGTLSDPNTVDKTATEITSSRQRTYATVVDTQKALQDALEQLLEVMDIWATIAKLAPVGTFEATFTFDDSVVVDKAEQFKTDLQLVSAGIMPKWEFRVRNFGEDELVARQKVLDVAAEQPAMEFPGG